MSKFFRIAATVVALAAIVVATGGAAAPAVGAVGGAAGGAGSAAAAASAAMIADGATVGFAAAATGLSAGASLFGLSAGALSAIAGGLGMVGQLLAKTPKTSGGSSTSWSADPNAGLPYGMGRTGTAGRIVWRQVWGASNHRQGIVTVYSCAGPVEGFEDVYLDGKKYFWSATAPFPINFPGDNIWETHQLGETPEASYLRTIGGSSPPLFPSEWDSSHKLNGLAASMINLKWDTGGDATMTNPPQLLWAGKWVKCYDPRKDSTYPGGSGAHRWADPSDTAAHDAARLTWEWSEDPYIHGLNFTLGRWERDHDVVGSKYAKIIGPGVGFDDILIEQFVEGANVCDANGWVIGGVIDSSEDKWDVLKKILEAGGGEPIKLGAKVGCIVNTPRVSLATIEASDIIGDASVQTTQPRRDRINCIIPKIRFERLSWEQDACDPVLVPEYVTFDGRQRNKEVTFDLVQCEDDDDPTQAVQLARYAIENAREFGPIVLPVGLRWYGYKPGDCLTVNDPEIGLNNQLVILLNRELEPADGEVTFTARSETTEKHPFALGQTGSAPATPTVTGPSEPPDATADAGSWSISSTSQSANGTTIPAFVISGAVGVPAVEFVIFEVREYDPAAGDDDNWQQYGAPEAQSVTTKVITGLKDATEYQISIRYRMGRSTGPRLILAPATADSTLIPIPTLNVAPEAVTVEQNFNGTARSGRYPITIQCTRLLGGSDTTASTDWSISLSGTLTSSNTTINNTPGDPDIGKITVIDDSGGVGASPTGTIVLACTRGDEQELTKNIVISAHVNPPADVTSDGSLNDVTSTSDTVMSDVLHILPSGTSVTCTAASINFWTGNAGFHAHASNLKLKWQYSANGTTGWSDVGSYVTGTAEVVGAAGKSGVYPGANGICTCNQTKTGLTSNVAAYFRLVGAAVATPADTIHSSGTAQIS